MSTITSQNIRSTANITRILGIGTLLSMLLLVGCVSITTDGDHEGGADGESQKNAFVVGENPTIDVRGFNGPIEIVVGEDGKVDVEAELKIPGRVSYSATVSNNTVTVVAKKIGSGITIGRSPQAEILLVVPERSTIKAHTSNGQIIIKGITGDGDLETSNGKITISDSDGEYTASTSNGSIHMSNVSGQFQADTSNGKIEFSGSMVDDTENHFTSSNGSISVTFQDDPNIDLDARTSNGTIDSDRPILATITEKTHLTGSYGDGSAELDVKTSNGSISIH
jgi:hypothetical protein